MNRLLRRFHRDQAGTSMTEFVITVPVFLILMVGIINLGSLAPKLSQVARYTATDMWAEAYQAEDETLRMSARYEWAELGSHQSWLGNLESAYLGATGHWGQSRLYAQPVMLGLTGRSIPSHGEYGRMRQNITSSPSNIIGDAHVATMMVNDTLDFDSLTTSLGGSPSSLGDIVGAVAGTAVAITGASAGFGAGIRYGQVRADRNEEFQLSSNPSAPSVHIGYSYSSLISPTPDGVLNPEQRSMLVARTSAEVRRPYNRLMDFWRSTLPNESYWVPNY